MYGGTDMKDKNYLNGYFTIEAALILPLVMLFITTLIFLAFYSYDRCIMELSAYEAALSGTSNHIKDTKEAKKEAKEAAEKLIEGKLFAISDVSCEADADATQIIVSYSGKINMPFISWLGKYISDTDFSINVSKKAKRSCQTKIIRNCRVVNKLISK